MSGQAERKPVIIGVCPRCAGLGYTGELDGDEWVTTPCLLCGASGNLDHYRLSRAYEAGRADALAEARSYLTVVQGAFEALGGPTPDPTYEHLRSRVDG